MSRKKSKSTAAGDGINKAEAARRASLQRVSSKKKKKVSHDKTETVVVVIASLAVLIGIAYLVLSSPPVPPPKRTKFESKIPDNNETRDPDAPLIIGGYLPDYRSSIDLDDSVEYLTDLMLFSLELKEDELDISDDGENKGCCVNEDMFELARDIKLEAKLMMDDADQIRENDELRVLLTVGGGGRSDGFSSLTASKEKRQKFIEDLKALCIRENIDGVDFNWELPTSQEDVMNYALLIIGVANEFHASGLIVTLALHPQQPFPSQAFQFIDRIHLMTYDMISSLPKGEESYGHHASFEKTVAAVDELTKHNCPAHKIVIGIPAYARNAKSPLHVKTYSEIVDGIMEDEEEGAVPSLAEFWNVKSYHEYMFDSPSDVARKVRFARDRGLGGVFFWELGQDKRVDGGGGFLLEAAGITLEVDREDKSTAPDGDEGGEETPDKSEL